MTGRPGNTWNEEATRVALSHLELARLSTFCLLNAILYLCTAALFAVLRLLLTNLLDERAQVAVPLLVQEQLCAVSLIVLAALLLRVRGVISLDQAAPTPAARVGRTTQVLALIMPRSVLPAWSSLRCCRTRTP